jgi:hypothetical protein
MVTTYCQETPMASKGVSNSLSRRTKGYNDGGSDWIQLGKTFAYLGFTRFRQYERRPLVCSQAEDFLYQRLTARLGERMGD